jgi:DNA adenine methylase
MEEKVFVPPLKMQGGKGKLVPFIQSHICMHDNATWIEPFMGTGAVGFNVAPHKAIFADTNPYIIDFYDSVKSGFIDPVYLDEYLHDSARMLERWEDECYYEVRDRFNDTHDPYDFLFLNRTCFNGLMRFNKDHEFNVSFNKRPNTFSEQKIAALVRSVTYIRNLSRRYDYQFVCQPFEKTIAMATANDFIYCDPPHLERSKEFYENWSEESETTLHQVLTNSGADYMVSTWRRNEKQDNQLLPKVWSDCFVTSQNHFYCIGAQSESRGSVMEVLLTNYPVMG